VLVVLLVVPLLVPLVAAPLVSLFPLTEVFDLELGGSVLVENIDLGGSDAGLPGDTCTENSVGLIPIRPLPVALVATLDPALPLTLEVEELEVTEGLDRNVLGSSSSPSTVESELSESLFASSSEDN
jgi:hypothetical protein